jgi:hypothetical protein
MHVERITQKELVNWWKYKEPMKRKLMRWIFGVNNVMPATLIEQRLDEVNISRNFMEKK